MLLGEMIRDLSDEAQATEALMHVGDLPLVARLQNQVGVAMAGVYAADAVARFADTASDEDWLALMNKLERADDPAAACLGAMVDWALKQDTDECHDGCSCHHSH
jgi:hypothetical protein